MKSKRLLAAAGTIAASVLGGWLAGYNFDYRGIEVAFWYAVTLAFAAFAAAYPFNK
jgi:hypothetical protein